MSQPPAPAATTATSHPPLCAVVLAAGEGRRLRPLTETLPKALCPVGNVPLLDRALARVAALGFADPSRLAVNACYLADQVVRHVGDAAHLSVESGAPLGTAGGLAQLRDWIGGRGVLVGNADGYLADPDRAPGPDIAALLAGWDGRTVRLLGEPVDEPAHREFGGHRFAGFSLLPPGYVDRLSVAEPNLVRAVWRPAEAAGELEVIPYRGAYLDCGTPADYLAANLHTAGGDNLVGAGARVTGRCERTVVGTGATVHGTVRESVVWPGEEVRAGEELTRSIRFGGGRTVRAETS